MAAMAPFGGGMGSSGQICGTLSGALAVIGFTLGKKNIDDRDHKLLWKMSYQMVKKFEEICSEFGGTDCSDIAGVNWKDRNSVKEFYTQADSGRQNCFKVIEKTCEYLQTLVAENFPDQD